MTAKLGGYLSKFFAVVFTTILAPVLVDLVVRDIHGAGHKPDAAPPSISQKEPPPPPSPSAEVVHIIVQGMGRTRAEALQNAFRTALLQAIADRNDASARADRNSDRVDAILRDGSGLIVSWKELGTKKEWRLKGSLYHREIAVTVDGRRLTERLRAAR